MSKVAALYVDARGPYPKLLGPDMCWDEARDARTYDGPWPVVAHPPCGSYGNLRHLIVPNEHSRAAADCGPIAVDQVRRFGGVLEQPAGSKLWDLCGLPRPGSKTIEAVEVEQVDWGHVARKRTWVYCVGVNPFTCGGWPTSKGKPTHWVSGGRKHDRKGSGGVVPPGIKVCSAQQRRRTPIAFAEWLVSLAASAGVRTKERDNA